MLIFFPDQYSCSDSVIWHLQSGQRTPTVYHFQVIHLLGQVPKTSSNSLYFIYHYHFSHANNYGLNFSIPYAPENQCFKQNIISCMFLTSSVNKFQQQQKKPPPMFLHIHDFKLFYFSERCHRPSSHLLVFLVLSVNDK